MISIRDYEYRKTGRSFFLKISFLYKRLPKRNLSLSGFTLIELLCVLLIITMFFSLSIPNLAKTAGNFFLKSKAAQIKSTCDFLKRASISQRKTHKLLIDFSQNSFSVLQSSDKYPNEFFPANDSLLRMHSLPAGMHFSSADNSRQNLEIVFSQSGSISSTEFFLRNNKEAAAKITTTLSGEVILEYL